MSAAGIITLALSLLQVVLGNLKSSSTTSNLETIISGIESAIASLEEVSGTPVTFDQLKSLRVEPKW